MKRALTVAGILLIAAAIALAFFEGGGGYGQPGATAPLAAEPVVRQGGSHTPVEYGSPVWSQFEVSLDGRRQTVLIKEYAQPEPLRRIIDKEKESPQGRRSPSNLIAVCYDSFSKISTKNEFLTLGQSLFADPERWRDTMESNVQLAAGGSWDEFIRIVRDVNLRYIDNKVFLGEAIVDNIHIYIHRPGPEYGALYLLSRQNQDGIYYIVAGWPSDLRPLLINGRILQLFPTIMRPPR